MLVVILVQEEAHHIVNPILHIVREREEYHRELFLELREISISRLPRNGVKYFET